MAVQRRSLLSAAFALTFSWWSLRVAVSFCLAGRFDPWLRGQGSHEHPADVERRERLQRVAMAAEAQAVVTDARTALDTLKQSALTREGSPEDVFESIRLLEKNKNAEGAASDMQPFLTGEWRLIYTTGTAKTEKEVGRINYVPIVAVQRFDMEKKFIRNGVYLGPISLEFEGELRWIAERQRLEFDFEELKICGMTLPLPDFIRGAAGMRSSKPYKKQPAFDFVAADGTVIAARGAGGGVALWLRNDLAA
eukprot:TRINITY_DN104606_c0_g1_i1.p1 TRINITY_DN104606_c0_g1~~TRINITY_DN104606_c0_g1_i1.p1  ORF type:complete len:251 (+),score=61.18 TRINITY_DN104606_c0_g1_i1:65-817(+)